MAILVSLSIFSLSIFAATELTTTSELFVYRNMANIVHEDVSNFMSTLQYTLEHLKVSSIIISGHQGCADIKYAYDEAKKSMIQNYISIWMISLISRQIYMNH